jgi:hypothetical protein
MKKLSFVAVLFLLINFSKSNFATTNDTLLITPTTVDTVAVIQFNIATNDTVWLDVFDRYGNTVKTFFNAALLPSGAYSIVFNTKLLPIGSYFIQLKINSTKTLLGRINKTGITNGVKELINNKSHLLLYPNPTIDVLNIPVIGQKNIIITDLNGKVLLNTLTENTSVNFKEFAEGTYILTVISDKKQVLGTQKIVKIN